MTRAMYMAMVFLMATAVVQATLEPTIDLGTAGDFALLTETGVTTTGTTKVTGDMGTSPIASTAITGFGLVLDSTTTFSTSSLVTGKVYAASYTSPTPVKMTTAISDMRTAYNDAKNRVNPDFIHEQVGDIEVTLSGGLHKWSSSVEFSKQLTFDAGNNEDTKWILQIAGDLVLGPGVQVILSGGAKASNIFWQVEGQAQIGAGALAEGVILCKTDITFGSEGSLNGRGLAQAAVTMIDTTIDASQA